MCPLLNGEHIADPASVFKEVVLEVLWSLKSGYNECFKLSGECYAVTSKQVGGEKWGVCAPPQAGTFQG